VQANLRGAFAGIQASITEFTFGSDSNQAVYGSRNIHQILADQVKPPKLAMNLRNMMPPGGRRARCLPQQRVLRHMPAGL
jgi:Las17-binding protein actin regulator